MKWRFALASLLLVGLLLFPLKLFVAHAADTAPLVISEVMTSGINEESTEDGQVEFIELHNQTADDLDVTGWKVQYFSAARTDVTDPVSLPTDNREVILNGKVAGYGYVLLGHVGKVTDADISFGKDDTNTSGWLARTGGHLRIVSLNDELIDRVGWGTSSTQQPETKVVAAAAIGGSIQRLSDPLNHDRLVDTDNNSNDFTALTTPTPLGGGLITDLELPDSPPNVPATEESDSESEPPVYYGLKIAELLPDPASPKSDSTDEFVELYNPQTFEVNTKGYILYTGSTTSTYKYVLPEIIIPPGEYIALYSKDTKLTLVNGTGYAWLTDPDGALLNEANWYSNIGTEKSWALIGDTWQITNVLTPGAPNQPANVESAEAEEADSVLAPCPEGKFRNPATNRCKTIEDEEVGLTACKPDQERNLATNRCRTVTAAGAVLAACKPGQERNPATNRCRAVAGVSTATACQTGYERNSETKRCRKVTATLAAATGTDQAPEHPAKFNFLVVGIVAACVTGYGIYEYRTDITNALLKIKAHIK